MTDEELLTLAREHPDELCQMIQSEEEGWGEFPMSPEEIQKSQAWVVRAEAALKTNIGWNAKAYPPLPPGFDPSKKSGA